MPCGCGKRTADAQTSAQVEEAQRQEQEAQRPSQEAAIANASTK